VDIYTQYTYEKKWMKTSQKDAGKTITLGECRFKA
jgi:hypothetical protein